SIFTARSPVISASLWPLSEEARAICDGVLFMGPTPPSICGVLIHSQRVLTYVIASMRGNGTWRACDATCIAELNEDELALAVSAVVRAATSGNTHSSPGSLRIRATIPKDPP